jgi:hypothetical protein
MITGALSGDFEPCDLNASNPSHQFANDIGRTFAKVFPGTSRKDHGRYHLGKLPQRFLLSTYKVAR